MSIRTYEIPYFFGLSHGTDENRLSPVFSTDAANVDTECGRLAVAKGYTRASEARVPEIDRIRRLFGYRTDRGVIPVCVTGSKVWALIRGEWTVMHHFQTPSVDNSVDAVTVRIGTTDYLVMADGLGQMIKFDGETVTPFGSAALGSDAPVSFLAVYRGRLFAAGERENPNRLYYSCLPGGGRTVEDWRYVEASPAVEGGFAEVGSVGGDQILALCALSNQLLIFKKDSVYRLIGDRPSNFTIERIEENIPQASVYSMAKYGDTVYFVTREGLYLYNGVSVRPCADNPVIREELKGASMIRCRAVVHKTKLYIAYERGDDCEMGVYDLAERKYLRRTGFHIWEIGVLDGKLYMMNRERLLYELESGTSYDGAPIDAYWYTPVTDLGDKAAIKAPRRLFLRGTGTLLVDAELDDRSDRYRMRLGETEREVSELPLFGAGRVLRLRFANENGGSFTLSGGAEAELSVRRRTE